MVIHKVIIKALRAGIGIAPPIFILSARRGG